MTKPASKIRFTATLLRPAESEKGAPWTFLTLPKNASAKLPTRGITPIEGTINGVAFQTAVEPDGQKSHWLKVNQKLSKSAGAKAGDIVTLEIAPAERIQNPGAGRSAQRSRRCLFENTRDVVGHYTQRAPRLDPLDRLRKTERDAHAASQKRLLNARRREASRLLLRQVRLLQ